MEAGSDCGTVPQDVKTSYINQWNLSAQKQFATDWLVSGNYIGSSVIHQLYEHEANPAVFLPGATVANTNQRRVLYLQNPDQGKYFSNIVEVDDGGTRSYNALVLSITRRRARGVTVQGNYTLSHCIDTGTPT